MNYCNLIAKIIKLPIEEYYKNNISVVEILVKFSPVKRGKGPEILNLRIWGNLAQDVMKYYKINDYIIVEGFLSFQKSSLNTYTQISVRKVYPYVLNNSKVNKTFLYQE
jgi:single-stranded DNA-binding protein